MSYTHKNLNEVQDAAGSHGAGDVMEVRFASGDLDTADTGLSHHRIKPGQRQGFGHKHENAEEVYLVLTGWGKVKLDEDVVELTQLDAVRVAPGVMRQFEAGEDGLEMVAFGPKHEGDGEIVPGWWASDM